MEPTADKPELMALLAFVCPAMGVMWVANRPIPLADAALFLEYGYCLLVDPASEEAVTRWEQMQRAIETQQKRKPKWFEQDADDGA